MDYEDPSTIDAREERRATLISEGELYNSSLERKVSDLEDLLTEKLDELKSHAAETNQHLCAINDHIDKFKKSCFKAFCFAAVAVLVVAYQMYH